MKGSAIRTMSAELHKYKGYVVCLLKHIPDSDGGYSEEASGDFNAVCLGNFGRVDVKPVKYFEEYMVEASSRNVEFVGSRKQLFLYYINKNEQSDYIDYDPKYDNNQENANILPFCWHIVEDGTSKHFHFCCISVININSEEVAKSEPNNETSVTKYVADLISTSLLKVMDSDFRFSVFGLLGTEDLCVISLSNSFTKICDAIDVVKGIEVSQNKLLVDSSRSVLMVDFSSEGDWGTSARAELHFSLRTRDGGASYLQTVKEAIVNKWKEIDPAIDPEKDIVLEEQLGVFDAVIRCPANALVPGLFGSNGLFSYSNSDYCKNVYQLETMLYTVAKSRQNPGSDYKPEESLYSKTNPYADIQEAVKVAIQKINLAILGKKKDTRNDLLYIKMDLYRLLKDFIKVASNPFNTATFREDLSIQFQVAVNAVVKMAENYRRASKSDNIEYVVPQLKQRFDGYYASIVESLDNALQAASQIDRLPLEEQRSHFRNTGAYHKVLLAYYGVVKDIIKIVYSIPRNENSQQELLIPLISFGYTPLVTSISYDSFYENSKGENVAKLICITMPYQALTNVPKYISVLAHEIFQYSTPTDQKDRLEQVGECLAAVGFFRFLTVIADDLWQNKEGCSGYPAQDALNIYPELFRNCVTEISSTIYKNLHAARPVIQGSRQEIGSRVFSSAVLNSLQPSISSNSTKQNPAIKLYCNAWMEFRSQLKSSSRDISNEISELFALKEDDTKAKLLIESWYKRSVQKRPYEFEPYLKIYEAALREIPADLFDLCVVMPDGKKSDRAEQYLWQLHRARSDKLQTRPSEIKHKVFDANTVRTSAVLSYLLFFEEETKFDRWNIDKAKVKATVEALFDKTSDSDSTNEDEEEKRKKENRKKEERKNLVEFTTNAVDLYATTQNKYFINHLLEYVRSIMRQIEDAPEQTHAKDEDYNKIKEKLACWYKRYYQELESHGTAEKKEKLFDIAIEMVEHYHTQNPFVVEFKSPPPRDDAKRSDGTCGQQTDWVPWELEILHPSELPGSLSRCYRKMFPKASHDGKEEFPAMFWFRGERDKNRPLLPGIMRDKSNTFTENGFLSGLNKMLRLAKEKLLPQGASFHLAEWLAFLQHYSFKTNLLDWSEDFQVALFFATEGWRNAFENGKKENLATDAVIYILNPTLLNLTKSVLDTKEDTKARAAQMFRLREYLEHNFDYDDEYAIPLFSKTEDIKGEYEYLFDLTNFTSEEYKYPVAATTPANNERMKAQGGQFVFYDPSSKPKIDGSKYTYENYTLEKMQNEYYEALKKAREKDQSIPDAIPFLYKIILSHVYAEDFVQYVRTLGLRRYKMFPEFDKLTDDIHAQAFRLRKK